jgi:hypothetical protein
MTYTPQFNSTLLAPKQKTLHGVKVGRTGVSIADAPIEKLFGREYGALSGALQDLGQLARKGRGEIFSSGDQVCGDLERGGHGQCGLIANNVLYDTLSIRGNSALVKRVFHRSHSERRS